MREKGEGQNMVGRQIGVMTQKPYGRGVYEPQASWQSTNNRNNSCWFKYKRNVLERCWRAHRISKRFWKTHSENKQKPQNTGWPRTQWKPCHCSSAEPWQPPWLALDPDHGHWYPGPGSPQDMDLDTTCSHLDQLSVDLSLILWPLTWGRKILWRRKRLPTPIFWPREFHELYSPWSHKESYTTEWLSLLFAIQTQT